MPAGRLFCCSVPITIAHPVLQIRAGGLQPSLPHLGPLPPNPQVIPIGMLRSHGVAAGGRDPGMWSGTMKRIVSIWLNTFALDCYTRQLSHKLFDRDQRRVLETSPFALVIKDHHGLRLKAVTPLAVAGGVYPGMRLSDARALLPSLASEHFDTEATAQGLQRLADWCQRYTPTVSLDGEDGLWLDVTGATHFYDDEADLLRDLSARLAALGFRCRLGLAETPGAAWAIARFATASTFQDCIITEGQVRKHLAPLTMAALRLEDRALYLLKRFGLKTIADLMDVPRASLKRRFPSSEMNQAVIARLDQALGVRSEPLVPLRPPPLYSEHIAFAEPILATESFESGLDALLKKICDRLAQDLKGATRLKFSAYRSDGGVSEIEAATARPSRDEAHWRRLFADKIATIDPGFGVDHLCLFALKAACLARTQMALETTAHSLNKDQNALTQLVDRLAGRLGEQSVQRVRFVESHIPERAEKRVPALSDEALNASTWCAHKPARPLRLLSRPEPISVLTEVPEGAPRQVTWRRMTHQVRRAEGPERIAPEWWHAFGQSVPRTRDYYRVETDQGLRFWLFRSGFYREGDPPPVWHMHGLCL